MARAPSNIPTVKPGAGAPPGAPDCPACGEPLFVWVETAGYGPREDEIVDRCESCGLVAARGRVPGGPEQAASELLASARRRSADSSTVRIPNPASLQAWFGAENWAALRPGEPGLGMPPKAAGLLFERAGMRMARSRWAPAIAIASMWQTAINLLTFHRDFAVEAASGRLRPGHGKDLAAWIIDLLISVLVAAPTAIIAVVLETLSGLLGRGGVFEATVDAGRGGEPQRRP